MEYYTNYKVDLHDRYKNSLVYIINQKEEKLSIR